MSAGAKSGVLVVDDGCSAIYQRLPFTPVRTILQSPLRPRPYPCFVIESAVRGQELVLLLMTSRRGELGQFAVPQRHYFTRVAQDGASDSGANRLGQDIRAERLLKQRLVTDVFLEAGQIRIAACRTAL